MEQCDVGDVFYYRSQHLRKTDKKHFHPVIVSINFGKYGMPQKGIVIITSHTEDREAMLKKRFGDGSYVVLDENDYSELSHKSIINAKICLEDEMSLLQGERKGCLPDDIVSKVKEAGKKHRINPPNIRNLL